jgi:hypothetical protein
MRPDIEAGPIGRKYRESSGESASASGACDTIASRPDRKTWPVRARTHAPSAVNPNPFMPEAFRTMPRL